MYNSHLHYVVVVVSGQIDCYLRKRIFGNHTYITLADQTMKGMPYYKHHRCKQNCGTFHKVLSLDGTSAAQATADYVV